MIIPVSYISLKTDRFPEIVFIVHLLIELVAGIVRTFIVLPKIEMKIKDYFKLVYRPVTIVFCLSLFTGYIFVHILKDNLVFQLIVFILSELFMIGIIYTLGLTRQERLKMNTIASTVKSKITNYDR